MWFALLSGCIEHKPPVRAATPTPVGLSIVLESFDTPSVTAGPPDVEARVAREATDRNLVVAPSPVDASFAELRSTDARLAALGSGAHLLLECAPRFSSQVNGRYRWSVEVTATLDPPRASRTFSVPVHLLYAHEDEDDALSQAAPVIALQVGALLDAWVEAK